MKIKNKDEIRRILFITLSNIGDIVLTLPVLSALRREFANAAIDVMSGPNGKDIFSGHPYVSEVIFYDKLSNIAAKQGLVRKLRKKRYNLIVDARNSLFPLLIGSRYRTSLLRKAPQAVIHKGQEHLARLKEIGLETGNAQGLFHIDAGSAAYADKLLHEHKVKKAFIVVSPGAKSRIKRWTTTGFAAVCDRIIEELGMDVVITGDIADQKIAVEIASTMRNRPVDLTAKLSLKELGALIRRGRILITNDSAPLHIGCAVNARVAAIFGPTDPAKYGPTGRYDRVIRMQLDCSPCEAAQCTRLHECMNQVKPEQVFEAVRELLKTNS